MELCVARDACTHSYGLWKGLWFSMSFIPLSMFSELLILCRSYFFPFSSQDLRSYCLSLKDRSLYRDTLWNRALKCSQFMPALHCICFDTCMMKTDQPLCVNQYGSQRTSQPGGCWNKCYQPAIFMQKFCQPAKNVYHSANWHDTQLILTTHSWQCIKLADICQMPSRNCQLAI